jgi:hypothetical protein
MSQRNVELLIGRLLTDEELRSRFTRAPLEAIGAFCDQGGELSRGEIDALVETDVRFWSSAASRIPSRLQRCSLRVRHDT